MNDLTLSNHDEACENLRALIEAENAAAWEAECAAHYEVIDEALLAEWLEDHDLPDTPDTREQYEDHLVTEAELRAGA